MSQEHKLLANEKETILYMFDEKDYFPSFYSSCAGCNVLIPNVCWRISCQRAFWCISMCLSVRLLLPQFSTDLNEIFWTSAVQPSLNNSPNFFFENCPPPPGGKKMNKQIIHTKKKPTKFMVQGTATIRITELKQWRIILVIKNVGFNCPIIYLPCEKKAQKSKRKM